MNHDQASDALEEWIDGELPAAASAAVKAHHDGCPECRSRAGSLRRLAAAAFPPPALSRASNEAFARAVMARVEAESALPAWGEVLARWLTPALGLALAASAAVVLAPSSDWPSASDAPGVEWALEAP
jgi:anti-sigma factor RsiW